MKFCLHAYIISYNNLDNWEVTYLFVAYFLFGFFAVHRDVLHFVHQRWTKRPRQASFKEDKNEAESRATVLEEAGRSCLDW